MRALISPNEKIVLDEIELGCRVAEISIQSFEVATPLFWVDYEGTTPAWHLYYDGEAIKELPTPLEVLPVEPISDIK